MSPDRPRLSPKSLLIQRLKQQGGRLSGKPAALASFLLEEYRKAAFMTAAEVASELEISPSTVIRFAASLGYDGYPALRRHLHKIVQEDLTGTDLFAAHLRRRGPNLLHSLVRREIENLSRLLKDTSLDDLDRLAGLIAKAERVFVVGLRASSALARYFGYHLSKIHNPVVTITNGSDMAFDPLSVVGAADVLIAIGFPRYPRETLEIVDFARREGVLVGAITDSVLSPLAKRADVVVPARAEVVSFVDSFCAPQVLLTALLVQVSVKNQAKTEGRLRRFEEIADRQRLFYSGA
ncbi:MAG: MurR/RpiR family transcriptional regulator [Candidatus Rokubacteria bacterium]|nr:MurR/RpiR family transcriptional regulator [Candidatus Rokubacteria bacterium]